METLSVLITAPVLSLVPIMDENGNRVIDSNYANTKTYTHYLTLGHEDDLEALQDVANKYKNTNELGDEYPVSLGFQMGDKTRVKITEKQALTFCSGLGIEPDTLGRLLMNATVTFTATLEVKGQQSSIDGSINEASFVWVDEYIMNLDPSIIMPLITKQAEVNAMKEKPKPQKSERMLKNIERLKALNNKQDEPKEDIYQIDGLDVTKEIFDQELALGNIDKEGKSITKSVKAETKK
jgi:hypothetical protein